MRIAVKQICKLKQKILIMEINENSGLMSFGDLVEEEWLWQGRFAKQGINLIVGDRGVGKAVLSAKIASAVSTGGQWPMNEGIAEKGCVAWLTGAATVKSRVHGALLSNGADLGEVKLIPPTRRVDQKLKCLSLGSDYDYLDRLFGTFDCSLLIVDTLDAFVSDGDAMANLSELAIKHDMAVIGLLNLGKRDQLSIVSDIVAGAIYIRHAKTVHALLPDINYKSRSIFGLVDGGDDTNLAFNTTFKRLSKVAGVTFPVLKFEDSYELGTLDNYRKRTKNRRITADADCLQEAIISVFKEGDILKKDEVKIRVKKKLAMRNITFGQNKFSDNFSIVVRERKQLEYAEKAGAKRNNIFYARKTT